MAEARAQFASEWEQANPHQMDLRYFENLKKFWRDPRREDWSFFCPLCKAPHKIPFQPKPTRKHFIQIGITTAFFTLMTWPWFDFKGVVAFFPLWVAFESLYRTRVRVSVRCHHCGFDPFLYLNDVQQARATIESHWRKIFQERGIPFPEKPVDPNKKEREDPPSQGVLLASSVKRDKA